MPFIVAYRYRWSSPTHLSVVINPELLERVGAIIVTGWSAAVGSNGDKEGIGIGRMLLAHVRGQVALCIRYFVEEAKLTDDPLDHFLELRPLVLS